MQFRSRMQPVCGAAPMRAFALFLLAAAPLPVRAADAYQASLDPVAFDNSTHANVLGGGSATASLSGSTLTVSGRYGALASAATAAHLFLGLGPGVPGTAAGSLSGAPVGDLAVSGGTDGQATGSVTLTGAQLSGLKAGGLYLVIDSEKAPAGNLWGWLMPAATP